MDPCADTWRPARLEGTFVLNRRTHRRIQNRLTQVPRAAQGRFTLAAICGFMMFSATFALATAIGRDELPAQRRSPQAINAEQETRAMVAERMHLHLKRLQSASSVR